MCKLFRSHIVLALLCSATINAQAIAHDCDLDKDVAELRYTDLARDLKGIPAGVEHDLFTGVLDNRVYRLDESVALLTPLVLKDLPPARVALVLRTLADDQVKLFHYAQANDDYDRLFAQYSDQLSPEARADDGDDNSAMKLLRDAPVQTMELSGTVDVPTRRDPLGSYVADITSHGVTEGWILDTGANITTLSESFARRLGLKLSDGTAQVMGSTGAENPLHVAVIDSLTLGAATLHNVVALVLPDSNLTVPRGKKETYVIPAILGFPVFQALETIRFTPTRFLAGPSLPVQGDSSAIYMDKLSPLLAVVIQSKDRVMLFDSGANVTGLSARYFHDFENSVRNEKRGNSTGYGAGGVYKRSVYIVADAEFGLAGQHVTLHHIAVQTEPMHMLSDHYEGSFGRDLLEGRESLTLDIAHAHFYLGTKTLDTN